MGLSASISNALSGLATSQASLEVVSRNVSNSGTPGYHVQSLNVIDTKGVNSTYARSGGIQRAFDGSLQAYYNSATSAAGYSSITNDMLDRLQTFMGKPGDASSLDTMFGNLQNAIQSLSVSPDDYATRSTAVSQAQAMASTLNSLSQSVQGLRQETETQMASSVQTLNQSLSSLQQINTQLGDQSTDAASRSALMDQRDRLVAQVSEQVDVNVDYRSDDTVALMTKTGVGLLDGKAATFQFQPAGAMTAEKVQNPDSSKSGVGTLTLVSSSGLTLDLVKQNVLQSGQLAALINLRDNTLVTAQSQLDDIASGLAQSFSTNTTNGTTATSGAQNGFSADLSGIRDGNDVTFTYNTGGADKTIKVVRVDDPTKLPLDYTDANGTRVLGADFSAGASGIAAMLTTKLGASSGLTITGTGNTLTVLDNGASGTSDVSALATHVTSSATQDGSPAFSLFVDSGNADYTNNLDGRGQKLGFASRISVNSAVLSNNSLLVQASPGASLGDATRANYVLDQMQNMTFASGQTKTTDLGTFRLGGTVSDLVSQTMDYTGSVAASAKSTDDTQQLTLSTVNDRMTSEYGVNVDSEMARLVELQNAYAANSRVISVVQDLMSKLLDL